jgi:hypothetical protein
MPGGDDKTKDTSPEPTLAELAKIMRETCSAIKDMGARAQALEVAAPATTVAMPEGFPYGLPGYGGIPPTSAPSTTTPQGTSALKPITEIPFPHSPSQPPLFTDRPNPSVTGRRTGSAAGGASNAYHAYQQLPLGGAAFQGLGVPRFNKLEFPSYDGSVDPLNWLRCCEQFFRGQQAAPADRVWLASYQPTINHKGKRNAISIWQA